MAKKKLERSEGSADVMTPPANYTVLARRYRPQQFRDLAGQEPAAQALINALQSNRVAHAYLFTGARGVGKTSTARILAKALNCVKGPTATPCDECESCKAIAVGEDVDVLEIDGASNNKVEEVRELRQNVGIRPARSRHKIYIIDEVHMLSTSAFNALLKTLEEPPPHVKFIFATTEVQKIPVTILSRCQRFDFSGIGTQRIVERLKEIVKSEKADVDDEALEIIARRASGSMRDAQSLLDQLLAFGEEKLTAKHVHQLLGTADEERVAGLAEAIISRDASEALKLLAKASEDGVQFGEFLEQLLDYWRDLMIIASAGPDMDGLTTSSRFRERLQAQAQGMTLDTILAGMDILAATKSRLRGTSHGRVLMEMAAVRLTRLENLVALSELMQRLDAGNGIPAGKPGGVTSSAPASLNVKKNDTLAQSKPLLREGEALVEPFARSSVEPSSSRTVPYPAVPLTEGTLPQIWEQALSFVGPMLRAELASADIAISAPNCLVLRFPQKYNKAKELCEDSARSERIEESLTRITSQKIAVRFEVVGSPQGNSQEAVADGPRIPPMQRLRAAVAQDPLVRTAMETLGAQLVRADEGFGTAASVNEDRLEMVEASDNV